MESKTPRTLSEPKSYTDLEYAVMYKSRCEKLETELAEAQTENNVLKAVIWYYCTQRGPNVIEELSEKVKRLESMILTIQAWNIDKSELRGHHCIAKQWICSLQDQIKRYKKGKR